MTAEHVLLAFTVFIALMMIVTVLLLWLAKKDLDRLMSAEHEEVRCPRCGAWTADLPGHMALRHAVP